MTTGPWADMEPEERAELEESIEGGYRDVENGNVVDAREFLAELRAKVIAADLLQSSPRANPAETR